MKYQVTIVRTKYSAWSTDPSMMAQDKDQLEEIMHAIKSGGNYGAFVAFVEDEKEVLDDDF